MDAQAGPDLDVAPFAEASNGNPSRRAVRHPGRLAFLIGFCSVPLFVLLFARISALCVAGSGANVERAVAEAGARRVVRALDRFQAEHHRLPTNREGLGVLVPEHLAETPVDPWGHPFAYVPSADRVWADVLSYGADGQPGGTGPRSDISGRFGSLGSRPSTLPRRVGEILFFTVLLVGFFGSRRWRWAAGMLAGAAALCALALLLLVASVFDTSPLGAATVMTALGGLTGCVALLQRLPGARPLALATTLAAYMLLGALTAG